MTRRLYATCVGWPPREMPALRALIEDGDDIDLARFRDMVDAEDMARVEEGLGYVTEGPGLRLENDWHVQFKLHEESGIPFMVHSGIEHVFASDDEIAALNEKAIERENAEMERDEVLVIVHPGSMYGSAEASLGRLDARAAREEVLDRVENHEGGIVIIDGAFSDEIPADDDDIFGAALEFAEKSGKVALRIWGDDAGDPPFEGWKGRGPADRIACGLMRFDGQDNAAKSLGPALDGTHVSVTGAWAEIDDESRSGCVNSVAHVLHDVCRGAHVEIDASAVRVAEDVDCDAEMEP